MNGLPDFYGQQYPSINPQRTMDGYAQDENMGNMNSMHMDSNMIGHSQTLDQIMNQNNQEMLRRRQSFHPQYQPNGNHEHARRSSMMEFGSTDLADFQFDPNPTPTQRSQMAGMVHTQKPQDPRKVRSREDLSLDTRFAQMNADYSNPNVFLFACNDARLCHWYGFSLYVIWHGYALRYRRHAD